MQKLVRFHFGLRFLLLTVVALTCAMQAQATDEWSNAPTSDEESKSGSPCPEALWDLIRVSALERERTLNPPKIPKLWLWLRLPMPSAQKAHAPRYVQANAWVEALERGAAASDSKQSYIKRQFESVLEDNASSPDEFALRVVCYLRKSKYASASDLLWIRSLVEPLPLDEIAVIAIRDAALEAFDQSESRTDIARAFILPWGEIHWTAPVEPLEDLSVRAKEILARTEEESARLRNHRDLNEVCKKMMTLAISELDSEQIVRLILHYFNRDRRNRSAAWRLGTVRESLESVPLAAHQVQRIQQKIFDLWYDSRLSKRLPTDIRTQLEHYEWGELKIKRISDEQQRLILARSIAKREGVSLVEVLEQKHKLTRRAHQDDDKEIESLRRDLDEVSFTLQKLQERLWRLEARKQRDKGSEDF